MSDTNAVKSRVLDNLAKQAQAEADLLWQAFLQTEKDLAPLTARCDEARRLWSKANERAKGLALAAKELEEA